MGFIATMGEALKALSPTHFTVSTASNQKSPYSRYGILPTNSGITNRAINMTFDDKAIIGASAYGYINGFIYQSYDLVLFLFSKDTISNPIARIIIRGADSKYALKVFNDSENDWETKKVSAVTYAPFDLMRYDVYISLGESGEINFYGGPIEILSWEGDTTISGCTAINRCDLLGSYVQTQGGQFIVWSGAFVSDEDSKGLEIADLPITADGTLRGWDGGAADVDEVGIATGDAMSATSSGLVSTFEKGAVPPGLRSGGYSLEALILTGLAASGLSAGQNLKFLHTADEVTLTEGASNALSVTYTAPQTIFTDVSGMPISEFDALKIGVKS